MIPSLANRLLRPVRSPGSVLHAGLAGLLLCCLAVTPAQALEDDRDQPIHITADQALRDENRGHTVYSGNVRLVQGSMKLDADRLTIWHQSEDADKFVAKGGPARMRQQPEPDQEIVHAQGDVITYLRTKQQVHLSGNARIEQRGDVVTGDSIVYFIERQLIKAESSERNTGERVSVVIQPSTQQGERDSGGDSDKGQEDSVDSQADGQIQEEPSGATESE